MADHAIPTRHELRSAHQVARTLHAPQTAVSDAQESFRRLPSNGVLGTPDFLAGQRVLIELELIEFFEGSLAVHEQALTIAAMQDGAAVRLLLELLLERKPPGWLRNVTATKRVRETLIPDRERSAVEEVVTDPNLRELILLEAGRRVNSQRLAELGEIGEEYVLERSRRQLHDLERPDLAEAVIRVSQISDQLGYDITAPDLRGADRRFEVKATKRAGWQAEVHLSRNEFEQGIHDPSWWLVVVEIDAEDHPKLLGYCRADSVAAMIPTDQHEHGKWMTVRLQQIAALLQEGLPPA